MLYEEIEKERSRERVVEGLMRGVVLCMSVSSCTIKKSLDICHVCWLRSATLIH